MDPITALCQLTVQNHTFLQTYESRLAGSSRRYCIGEVRVSSIEWHRCCRESHGRSRGSSPIGSQRPRDHGRKQEEGCGTCMCELNDTIDGRDVARNGLVVQIGACNGSHLSYAVSWVFFSARRSRWRWSSIAAAAASSATTSTSAALRICQYCAGNVRPFVLDGQRTGRSGRSLMISSRLRSILWVVNVK